MNERIRRTDGARSLKRAIQRLIKDPLALRILDAEVLPGDHIAVDADPKKREMTFERASAKFVHH